MVQPLSKANWMGLNNTVKSGNCEVLPIFNYLNVPTDSSSKDEYEVAKKKN